MTIYLSREQSQAVDRIAIDEFSMDGRVLMENAAIHTTLELLPHLSTGDAVLVVAGAGNNGGDGLAIARQLYNRGFKVAVLWVADDAKASPDCLVNWKILEQTSLPRVRLSPGSITNSVEGARLMDLVSQLEKQLETVAFTWVVDALLGTGARGAARPPMDTLIHFINDMKTQVLAVDLPSGLDCETGRTGGAVIRANLTCTFVAEKQAFSNPQNASCLGIIRVASIGTPPEVLRRVLNR